MTGPSLVLIPGWGMEEPVWEAFLPHLHDFPVHVVHWRNSEDGHEFQRRIIEVAEGKEVILVGWSLGALAALQVHHSLQTKGIVLLGGTAKFTTDADYIYGWKKPFVERMNRNLLKQKDDTLKRFYVSMFSKAEQENGQEIAFLKIAEQFQGDSIHSLQCGLHYLIETDVREQLLQIDVPVLLLHGKDDVICPPSAAEYIQEKINASLTIIEGAGHALCFTQAKRCAKEIIQFVKGIERND
ncbi:alpha/beta fold hydrolase [Bacillus cereus group sp. BfR-BA-01380]|uniref:alpha/beta fold hydrolase n=1 Tax=Bacillus cereus group sp. BfR-BA-01380 TaxID=2920324 RepID=UPI001F56607A|nr:alpha/beta hydrolase [Bacillus cereus group sp. BfR-BA-01380]